MIEVYLKHRPEKPGYTEYWKEIFNDTNKYKVYELTEEDRPNCIPIAGMLKQRIGGVFGSHITSFLHSTTDYHWAIDSEDIKFEEKIKIEDIRNLLEKVETCAINNNYDGLSYDMYLTILAGEDKEGQKPGIKFKDIIKHWSFGIAFLKKQPDIFSLIFNRQYRHPWNMDWRMSELREDGVLSLKTFIVTDAKLHHTWGDIIVEKETLDHNGVVFTIQPEVIKFTI